MYPPPLGLSQKKTPTFGVSVSCQRELEQGQPPGGTGTWLVVTPSRGRFGGAGSAMDRSSDAASGAAGEERSGAFSMTHDPVSFMTVGGAPHKHGMCCATWVGTRILPLVFVKIRLS
eukprot:scaffold48096_cov33-Tisochrysis_lutea.AAC.4